jgi:hypothetical protein
VGSQTRFAGIDRAGFDGHRLNWDLLLARQPQMLDELDRGDKYMKMDYHPRRSGPGAG